MAKPTNPVLVAFHPDIESKANADSELYQVTSHILVKKGTNFEQLMADWATGKAGADNPPLAARFVDITKIK